MNGRVEHRALTEDAAGQVYAPKTTWLGLGIKRTWLGLGNDEIMVWITSSTLKHWFLTRIESWSCVTTSTRYTDFVGLYTTFVLNYCTYCKEYCSTVMHVSIFLNSAREILILTRYPLVDHETGLDPVLCETRRTIWTQTMMFSQTWPSSFGV